MSTAPDEFEKLQKLLKLKRHEQPPPGYFNSFPTRVINRIEREAERGEVSWFNRLFAIVETNPIAAGLFGMSVCGLLITGITYSQVHGTSQYSADTSAAVNVADLGNSALRSTQARQVDSLAPSSVAMFNTNASVFDTVQLPSAERVNYQLNQ